MRTPISRRHLLRISALAGLGGILSAQTPIWARTRLQTKQTLASAIATAATNFLATLDDAGQAKSRYAFSDSERYRWHWTTPAGYPRNGLPLNAMTAAQQTASLALLQASTSPVGYQKALDIMALQTDLGNDPKDYYVTIFGEPGGKVPWGWRFEGHHLSRNFTVAGEQVVMTPFFLGAWPTENPRGLRAMPREEDAARELITLMSADQRNKAIFSANTLNRHVTQNQSRVTPLAAVGIAYADISAAQQALVQEIVQTYLSVLPDTVAAPALERIVATGWDTLHFGWAGPLEARRSHYYRLQGATFLLEFDNSRNGGTHIHSVWRDFDQDFGDYLLG